MRRVIFAAAGLLALINAVACVQTLADAAYQYTLGLPYSPVVRAALSALWAVLLGWAALRAPLARLAPLFTAYGIYGVLWLALFARSDYARGRIPFQIGLTAVLLIPVWWVHWRRSRSSS